MGRSQRSDAEVSDMNEVVILAGGGADLQRLFEVYEDRQEGLGLEFHSACEEAFGLLSKFPYMAPVYQLPYRRFLLRRWIVGVFYAFDGKRVIVHAALDLREDPNDVRRRLGFE